VKITEFSSLAASAVCRPNRELRSSPADIELDKPIHDRSSGLS